MDKKDKEYSASDYVAMLADAEAKKAGLEALISGLRAALVAGALGPAADVSIGVPPATSPAAAKPLGEPVSLPRGAFLGKTATEAIKLCLSAVRQKKTNKEIAQALKEGGLESTGNFDNYVTHGLYRLKKDGVVLRFDDGWGLAEWYPESFRNRVTQDKAKGGKKKGKAKGKKKAAQGKATRAKVTTPKARTPDPQNGQKPGPKARIDNLLLHAPNELKLEAIAKQAEIEGLQVARMFLGKLIKEGRVEKTASGAYRRAGAKAA